MKEKFGSTLNLKRKGKRKMLKKILDFIDCTMPQKPKLDLYLGTLYKIKGEALPFRYIRFTNEVYSNKPTYHFKHHQLKEHKFHDLSKIEREANPEEIRIYNLIKDHVNEVAENN